VEVLAVPGVLLAVVEEAFAINKGIDEDAVIDARVEVAVVFVDVASSAMAVAMLAPKQRKTTAPIIAGRLIRPNV
jgi:hypothetical protein